MLYQRRSWVRHGISTSHMYSLKEKMFEGDWKCGVHTYLLRNLNIYVSTSHAGLDRKVDGTEQESRETESKELGSRLHSVNADPSP